MVSFEDTGLESSADDRTSKWKGFLVNSSARGDISASISSAACRETGAFGSFDCISVCSLCSFRCSRIFGEENLVLIAFDGVERNAWLGVCGVSGAFRIAIGIGVCDSFGAMTSVPGGVLTLSTLESASWLCFGIGIDSGVGAWKNGCVCAVRSSEANPLKV